MSQSWLKLLFLDDAVGPAATGGPAATRRLPQPLRIWLAAVLVLTAANVVTELICHFALGLRYPYDWPFVAPVSRFGDLLDWLPQFRTIHTEAFFHQRLQFLYPAPVSIVYTLFLLAGRGALTIYLALAASLAGTALLLLGKCLRANGVRTASASGFLIAVLLTSYPFWFVVHTANLELVVSGFTMTGVWAFSRGRQGMAASLFGVAAAMKIYPVLYLLLFLKRGTWGRVVQGVVLAAAIIAVSLWVVYPKVGVSWSEMRLGTAAFIQQDGLHFLHGRIGFDHSLFALIKTVLPPMTTERTARVLSAYFVVVAITASWLWFQRVSKQPVLAQVLFLSTATILLPPVSYDYTLVHLYAPWAMLVVALAGGRTLSWAGWSALGCFAIIFTAQGYILSQGDHFAAQLKCVAMLGLMVAAATASLFKERQPVRVGQEIIGQEIKGAP